MSSRWSAATAASFYDAAVHVGLVSETGKKNRVYTDSNRGGQRPLDYSLALRPIAVQHLNHSAIYTYALFKREIHLAKAKRRWRRNWKFGKVLQLVLVSAPLLA